MNNKIAVLFDSDCGRSKEYVESKGGFIVPILIDLNNKTYESAIDFDSIEFEKMIDNNSKVKTAAVTLGKLQGTFKEILDKGYEKIVYFSLSKGLSSTNETAKLVSNQDEFKGKVFVYDSELISPWKHDFVETLIDLVKTKSLDDVFAILDRNKKYAKGIFSPGNLQFLRAGGRITKIQYIAASLFKVFPLIPAYEGRINTDVIKVRSIDKAYEKAVEVNLEWLKEADNDRIDAYIGIIGTNKEHVDAIRKVLNEKGYNGKVTSFPLSPEIIAHVGPNYWGVGVIPVIK